MINKLVDEFIIFREFDTSEESPVYFVFYQFNYFSPDVVVLFIGIKLKQCNNEIWNRYLVNMPVEDSYLYDHCF